MDHIFLHADIVDNRIKEIAFIRTDGKIGQVHKRNILAAFSTDNFQTTCNLIRQNILSKFDDRYVVVSQYSSLFRSVLTKECETIKEVELFNLRAWLDIGQLAWPLVISGIANLPLRTVFTLAQYYGIAIPTSPSVEDSCTALVQVYAVMMQRYKTALIGEDAMRGWGGETLENLRKIVGF